MNIIEIIKNFNWIDEIFILIICFSSFVGFYRGFLKEIISFIKWTLIIIGTIYLGYQFSIHVSHTIYNTKLSIYICYIISFFIVFIVASILIYCFNILFISSEESIINKILGIIIGIIRGMILIIILTYFIQLFGISKSEIWKSTYFNQYIEEGLKIINIYFKKYFFDFIK